MMKHRRLALSACALLVLLPSVARDPRASGELNSTRETDGLTGQSVTGNMRDHDPENSELGPGGNRDSAYQADYVTHVSSFGWQFLRGQGPFREGYTYQFFPDGAFIWSVISDYTESVQGRWDYKVLSNTRGLLFLFSEGNGSVLYSEFVPGNKFRLGGFLLDPIPIQQRHRSLNEETKGPDIINKTNFRNYFLIAARPWKKSNTEDDDFVPTSYVFNQDGAFLARYRDGKCQHNGYWSLRKNKLLLEMPQNHCDVRGNSNAFNLELDYDVEPTSLVFGHKYAYTPTN